MNPIVPGRFNGASINTEGGELEVRLSEGGNWQLKVRTREESDWRLICSGHLDGNVFTPPPDDDRAPIRLGPLRIDLAARRVDVRGVEASLTAREFDLLAILASDPGRIFTKEELLREVWGHPGRSATRTLESHACRARVKLRRAGADGFIVNYRDLGYKLWKGVALDTPTALRAV